MKRKVLFLLTIFGLLLAVYVSGCTSFVNVPGSDFGNINSLSNDVTFNKFVERSNDKILLDVPFLPQVPPGTWSNTRNCGHTCAVMMRAYYFEIEPLPEHIIQADEWLNVRFGLPINNHNGDWTNCFQIRAWLESESVPAKVGMGNLERARTMLADGKPFLAAVYSNMNTNGGAKHAMLVIGIDSNHIYVNGNIHTNTIEGFWSQLKRSIDGTYHHVSTEYLNRYVDEYSFRYNHRKDEQPMFFNFLAQI